MYSSESPSIIVLGAERSGTSIVADLETDMGYCDLHNNGSQSF